ncbi:MAG: succinyl-CoA synthetase subunit alpha [Nanoarchaeota archaeon]|nr:succinyl-CoA synthetase subunit alpha [Nanoarchaeota archaeon]MBU1988944.1 succinyl-CoA synthetase subunit alpha [Nanoarchaeota archaeon]
MVGINMVSNYEVFLKTDLKQFVGKWVAIAKTGVVAVGENAKKVYEEAQMKMPGEKIMLYKVPEEETMIF